MFRENSRKGAGAVTSGKDGRDNHPAPVGSLYKCESLGIHLHCNVSGPVGDGSCGPGFYVEGIKVDSSILSVRAERAAYHLELAVLPLAGGAGAKLALKGSCRDQPLERLVWCRERSDCTEEDSEQHKSKCFHIPSPYARSNAKSVSERIQKISHQVQPNPERA